MQTVMLESEYEASGIYEQYTVQRLYSNLYLPAPYILT